MTEMDLSQQNELLTVSFTLNGKPTEMSVRADQTALSALRDRLGYTGTKEGCGIGECGACTILVDGRAYDSCLMLAAQLEGRDVVTVEGLADGDRLHPLQEAFLEEGAVQCGFCTPGMLLSAKALLDENPRPSRAEIIETVSGNLCRCTGYEQIVRAVERTAGSRKDGGGK